MIVTKITFTDTSVLFADALDALYWFFGQNPDIDVHLHPHSAEALSSEWILNYQTFEFNNQHSLGVVNYSADQEKATLFAESLTFWHNIMPPTTTWQIDQYPVSEIPAQAVPIMIDGEFYLTPSNATGAIDAHNFTKF